MIRVAIDASFSAFRAQARALLARDVRPSDVLWDDASSGQQSLFEGQPLQTVVESQVEAENTLTVPARLVGLLERAVHHRAADRFALAYRVLYRVTHGERELLERVTDPDVLRLRALVREIDHCIEHVHAFVRFRRVQDDGGERFVAFYRPEHPVLPLAAPFFARRFASMRWALFTPDQSVAWDGARLAFGPGAAHDNTPSDDDLEDLFRVYYASIFNPARVNPDLLRKKLPPRHWPTLPESEILHDLLRDADARVQLMHHTPSASEAFLPEQRDVPSLRAAAARCTACPLFERATQTVFGEGPERAELMLIGEQPGDEEDRAGQPFVGPAGQLLDACLAAAGIARERIYVTNAVKHFKWEPRGKRRLHSRPNRSEQLACSGWLREEIEALQPRVLVCLGATAAQAVLGRKVVITRERGALQSSSFSQQVLVTYHPSAILRMQDDHARSQARLDLEHDLRRAAELLTKK